MQDAKADGKSNLPEWVGENKQFRSLLKSTERNGQDNRTGLDLFQSQRKFTHLMKTDPKQAERLDFRYAEFCFDFPRRLSWIGNANCRSII